MNSRIYPEELYQRKVSRIIIGKLSCPNCFSSKINTIITSDDCECQICKSKFEFKELLNQTEVRDKKIERILS